MGLKLPIKSYTTTKIHNLHSKCFKTQVLPIKNWVFFAGKSNLGARETAHLLKLDEG